MRQRSFQGPLVGDKPLRLTELDILSRDKAPLSSEKVNDPVEQVLTTDPKAILPYKCQDADRELNLRDAWGINGAVELEIVNIYSDQL